jgi:hypothetical protein
MVWAMSCVWSPVVTLLSAAEAVGRLETEKAAIHSEYEQERIAYQKLLKDFNRMEAVADNLRDEVDILKGGGHNRTVSNVSMVSLAGGESAYGGSLSGQSSLVSTLDRSLPLPVPSPSPSPSGGRGTGPWRASQCRRRARRRTWG